MAVRNALVGRYAEASLGGVLIALLTEWEVTYSHDTADGTAHGDVWKHNYPLDSGWTFRAKGFVVPGSASHYLNALWSSGSAVAYFTVAGYSGSVASGTKIFEGSGLPVRGTITAPMEMAVQEFEIQGEGAPTAGV
jgi:hypothetical protein